MVYYRYGRIKHGSKYTGRLPVGMFNDGYGSGRGAL